MESKVINPITIKKITIGGKIYNDLIKSNSLDVKYKDSKRYWFREQEIAIVEYIESSDFKKRNEI